MVFSILLTLFFVSIVEMDGLTCTNGFTLTRDGNATHDVASLSCLNGRCASLTMNSSANYVKTAMFCVPEWLLNGSANGCGYLTSTGSFPFCVCDTDNCNRGTSNPQPPHIVGPPILCYDGLVQNSKLIGRTGSSLIACNGACVSVSINTTLDDLALDVTYYTCMPKEVLSHEQVPMDNYCFGLDAMISCRCLFSACLDPSEKGDFPEPKPNLECLRGTHIINIIASELTFEVGVPCNNGMCGMMLTIGYSNISTDVAQFTAETFCASHEMVLSITGQKTGGCAWLDNSYIYGSTDQLPSPLVCFCASHDDCNGYGDEFAVAVPAPPTISCFEGLAYNGSIPFETFTQCSGICTTTFIHEDIIEPENMTVYTCGTELLCKLWRIPMNTCGQVYNNVNACCCDTPNCNQPQLSTIKPNPGGCPAGWTRSAVYQKCFLAVTEPTSWSMAESTCRGLKRGSSLVSIASAFENSEIAGLLPISSYFWLGLENLIDNDFKWIDSQKLTYTAWANGEPSGETCVRAQASSRKWSTVACNSSLPFVCELFI